MTVVQVDAFDGFSSPSAVCLGFFDGVHIGHAALIRETARVAAARGWIACAHTFDRMPTRTLSAASFAAELTPLPEKARLMASLGIEAVAVSRFDDAMMHMPADRFLREILIRKLRAAHITIGFHHRFGFRGEGNAQTLRAFCEAEGIGVSVIPPVTLSDGTLVSSTAIRGYLENGDQARAEEMLGRQLYDGIEKRFGREGS